MYRRRLLAWLGIGSAAWPGGRPLRAAQGERSPSRRVALVIGNAQYLLAPLANPENDAMLVGSTLKRLGFEVATHLNLKAREFKRELRNFSRWMDDDDTALVFYYAGHGLQIDRRNYLLPVDLNLRDEGEIADEAIDLEEALLRRIDRVQPRARIFIIDSCRDSPFPRRPRGPSTSGGLAETAAPGALIAFSAAPGRTAEDGPPGSNSVYTRLLAQEMMTEGVEVEEMLKNVRVKVLRETQERQIPWVNTSMVVNFVFNQGSGITPASATLDVPGRAARSLRLSMQAELSLNTDRKHVPASLALHLYVLRDSQVIHHASFDSLYDNDEATLGSALMRRERVHLRPGETREIVLDLGKEARFVAVVAAFREVERAQWRSVLALPEQANQPHVSLSAQARQVQLAWVP